MSHRGVDGRGRYGNEGRHSLMEERERRTDEESKEGDAAE